MTIVECGRFLAEFAYRYVDVGVVEGRVFNKVLDELLELGEDVEEWSG